MKHRFFSYHYSPGFSWFRVYGYGLHIKNIKLFMPSFSERYGYKKRLLIGNYSITTLNPDTRC